MKVDDNASAPFSSMARLVLQDGDEIKYARLFWSGRLDQDPLAAEMLSARTAQIKGPTSSTYTTIVSDESDFYWKDYTGSATDFNYVASIEVTDYITTNRDGEYYVGDVDARSGTNTYGSWQLMLIVSNDNRSLKNIAIFQGFKVLANGDSVEVPASGFITPVDENSSFEANLFVYTGEADADYADTISVCDKADCSDDFTKLTDGLNDDNDVANGSVWSIDYGYRDTNQSLANPNYRNVLGLDIDKLPVNIKDGTQILQNAQIQTELKLTSGGDTYSLNMFAFETEVFIPSFCYDYGYSQESKTFTENNDGTQAPRLYGDVTVNKPIEMTIYLKSLVDNELSIENMVIEVLDINRSQATYIDPSTKLATTGEFIPTDISPTVTSTATTDNLSDINIGTLAHNDYFYLYYSLDPQISTMDMPIKVNAKYDLILDTATVPYNLTLSEEIPLCSSNGFDYTPAIGVFNVVHNNYYTNTSTVAGSPNGTEYYNLPTQVTSREGNFKVLAMDPDNLDLLKGISTVVALEMIDAGKFHTTDASCSEYDSSITDRVWLVFDDNATSVPFDINALQDAIDENRTTLTSTSAFYDTATKNTAFRVSYNVAEDSNNSAAATIYVDKESDGTLTMNNWEEEWYGEDCARDMDGMTGIDKIADYCSATGNNASTLSDCMECIYGIKTKFVCSRDNFSIRPDAFNIKLNDQDQTNFTTQLRIVDDVSGVTGTPSTTQTELAAGYKYNLEINATNHLDSNASYGYSKTFELSDNATYTWKSASNPDCNDEDNKSIEIRFNHGVVDTNTSVDQVGEYNLNITDTTWTTVDQTLHTTSDFQAGADCVVDSSLTQAVNVSTLNGCNISSNHDSSGSSLQYRDYDIEFHPYKFDMNNTNVITASYGENNTTTWPTKPFIYMANLSTDEEMSFHLNGKIGAVGYNDSQLSNFVDGCYAKPVELNINRTHHNIPVPITYGYKFDNLDINGAQLSTQSADINITSDPIIATIDITASSFSKDLNGSLNTNLNLNFDRNQTIAVNPERVTYNSYTTNCQIASDCTMDADLTTQETKDGNATATLLTPIIVQHYYGRSHAPRYRFSTQTNDAFIYYETFCYETDSYGTVCDKTLLQNENDSNSTDDPRWFINTNHILDLDGNVTFGTAGTVTQKGYVAAPPVTSTIAPTGDHQDFTRLFYNESKGYPYKTTMQLNSSTWLIYNKYDSDIDLNEFEIEYGASTTSWGGKADTNTTTKDSGTNKTNRRHMW